MSRYMNPITACCAAVLMLGLAACGDSKKTTTMTPTTPTTPMATDVPLTTLQAGYVAMPGTYKVTGATDAALMTLLMALGRVDVPDGGFEEGSDAVTAGGLMLQCSPESAANCNMTIDEENGLVTVTGTIRVAAVGRMFPQTADERMAETARIKDAAVTKEMAMAAEAAQGATGSPTADLHEDAGLGGTVTTTGAAVDTYSLAISRDSAGTTIEIADTANAGANDPKFAQAADMMDGRTMHVRANSMTEEEVVIVYTDIEAPTPTPFAMVHMLDLSTDTTNDTPEVTHEALIVGNTPEVRALVKSAGFAARTAAELTFPDDDTSTANMDEAYEVAGTYDGAMGTYRCNGGTDCTVRLDAMGAITNLTGDWIFTPTAGAMSPVPDDDHLHYGFWLKRTKDSNGNVTGYSEVETFAGSSVAASGDVASVPGTASYTGGAVGVYMMKHKYDETTGELEEATSGHFKARARLTARFGGDTVPVADNFELEGTIDRFVLSGGETNTWAVKLEEAEITQSSGTASGDAMVGDEDAGSFSATFHGDLTAASDGTVPQPGSVVGEFDAEFSNGRVAGAFGARKPAQ